MLTASAFLGAVSLDEPVPIEWLLGLIPPPDLCPDETPLCAEPYEAYMDMRNDADRAGIKMWCTSGYRSFDAQKGIWNTKYQKLRDANPLQTDLEIINQITAYSSIPGFSRHHWGTDLDITDAFGFYQVNPLSEENYMPGGDYQFLNVWLEANSTKYGFYQTYTNDTKRTGFKYEPWHYSYAPIARKYVARIQEFTIETQPRFQELKGIAAMDATFIAHYKKNFLLGINPALKP